MKQLAYILVSLLILPACNSNERTLTSTAWELVSYEHTPTQGDRFLDTTLKIYTVFSKDGNVYGKYTAYHYPYRMEENRIYFGDDTVPAAVVRLTNSELVLIANYSSGVLTQTFRAAPFLPSHTFDRLVNALSKDFSVTDYDHARFAYDEYAKDEIVLLLSQNWGKLRSEDPYEVEPHIKATIVRELGMEPQVCHELLTPASIDSYNHYEWYTPSLTVKLRNEVRYDYIDRDKLRLRSTLQIQQSAN